MPGTDRLHLREILVRLRLRLRGVDDRVVAEDLERGAVGRARQAVAEVVQRTHDGERAAVEAADAFEAAERLVVVALRPADHLQPRELLDGPLPPPEGLELRAQLVGEIGEVARVGGGVLEHLARQRALGPVGALMRLIELEREVPLQQRGQADGLVP